MGNKYFLIKNIYSESAQRLKVGCLKKKTERTKLRLSFTRNIVYWIESKPIIFLLFPFLKNCKFMKNQLFIDY